MKMDDALWFICWLALMLGLLVSFPFFMDAIVTAANYESLNERFSFCEQNGGTPTKWIGDVGCYIPSDENRLIEWSVIEVNGKIGLVKKP